VAVAPVSPSANTRGWGDIPQPKLAGFSLDLSFSDGTALNAENYSNGLSLLLEPNWAVGLQYLKNTPFKTLNIGAKFSVGRALAGYDPSSVTPDNGTGPLGTCSNVAINSAGSVDPGSISRCNTGPNNYRFEPSDLSFTIATPGIYKIPLADVRLNPSVRVTVPLSYQSRYASIITVLQAAIGAGRSFLNDKISVGYSFSFSKYFDRYATPQIQTTTAPNAAGLVTNNYDNNAVTSNNAGFYANEANASPPGGFNSSYGFSNVFNVGYQPIKKLSFSVTYVLSSSFSYAGNCGDGTYGGVTTNPCANANAVAQSSSSSYFSNAAQNGWKQGTAGINIRDSQTFVLSASYDVTNWASVFLQWVNASPLRDQANNVYQPFISTNYNAFTNVSLGASFSLGHGDE
jgi:hypothetical protein